MTGEQPHSGNPASPSGSTGRASSLLDHVSEFFASGLEYIQARLALAGLEAKEALLHFAIILGLLVASIGVILFGYLFLCIALTVLIAAALGISPGWVILGLAILHFVVAGSAVGFAILKLKTSVFTETLSELKKDQQWLNRASRQS